LAAPKKAGTANPQPIGNAVKRKEAVDALPALLPQPVASVTSFANRGAAAGTGAAGGNAAADGLQLLQVGTRPIHDSVIPWPGTFDLCFFRRKGGRGGACAC
jgi:hypothetical protein